MKHMLNFKGRLIDLDTPLVMGILNLTPDSFYSGSRYKNDQQLVDQAGAMLEAGARILDLGGQSTRPGSQKLDASMEMERVLPAIHSIKKAFPESIISIDTYYSVVVKEAVSAGAAMVNDISGGTLDPAMISTVATLQIPYVLMHIKGDPQTMQAQASYENITREVLDYFIKRTAELRDAGILDIIIDPGFGFAKNPAQNLQLIRELDLLKMLNRPVMAGISRKSTIYKTLGITAEESLNGTTVLNTICLLKGASILRVHDVKEAIEAIRLVQAYISV